MTVYEQLPAVNQYGDEALVQLVEQDNDEPDADYVLVGKGIVWITVGTYQVMINAQAGNVYVGVQRYGEPDEDIVSYDGDYDAVIDEIPHGDLMSLGRVIAGAYAKVKGGEARRA